MVLLVVLLLVAETLQALVLQLLTMFLQHQLDSTHMAGEK
jgi:hypothetical protein